MDNIRLKYFIVLSEIESVRKAAEMLHISPAALSKAIKVLEFELGITLLVPNGRGIAITNEGRELVRQAKPFLNGLEQIKKRLKEKKQFGGFQHPIRLGTFEIFSTYFLKALIDYLPSSHEFLLREILPGDIEKSLLAEEIDYGITYAPVPMAGVHHHPISSVSMAVFALDKFFVDYPLSDIPFVIPVQPLVDSPGKVLSLDGWPDGQIKRFVKYKVAMMESALELCRQGKAAAYLPEFVIHMHNQIVKEKYQLFPISNPALPFQTQKVYLATRKVTPDNKILEKISEAIRTFCL